MDIIRGKKQLLITDPFYGMFLLGTNVFLSDLAKTTQFVRNGVNINSNYWENLEDKKQLALLKMLAMAILFKLPLKQNNYEDEDRFITACNCLCNSYNPEFKTDPYDYPEKYGLESEKDLDYYYDNLPVDNPFKNESPDLIIDPFYVGGWEDFRDIPESEYELIDGQIDYHVKNTAIEYSRACGSYPGLFSDYINSLFAENKPAFNWKKYLRRLLGSIYDATSKNTYMKENIRFPQAVGIKHSKKAKLLVAVDTSGSVSNEELQEFFAEIYRLWKAGAEVEILEFDHALQNQYIYTGNPNIAIHGRGGTSFDGPFC